MRVSEQLLVLTDSCLNRGGRVHDILRVTIPNGAVLGFINLVDLKTIAEIGLIGLSAGYTVWRWRRDAKTGGRRTEDRGRIERGTK